MTAIRPAGQSAGLWVAAAWVRAATRAEGRGRVGWVAVGARVDLAGRDREPGGGDRGVAVGAQGQRQPAHRQLVHNLALNRFGSTHAHRLLVVLP